MSVIAFDVMAKEFGTVINSHGKEFAIGQMPYIEGDHYEAVAYMRDQDNPEVIDEDNPRKVIWGQFDPDDEDDNGNLPNSYWEKYTLM